MSKIDNELFSQHEHALEDAYGLCDKCGASLHIRNSKNGPFLGCSTYPQCDFIKPLHHHDHTIIKELEVDCPSCTSPLAVKNGRYGMFIGCTNFPECHYVADLVHAKDSEKVICPGCGKGELVQRANKYGKSFYACDQYPKCKFAVNHEPVIGMCEKCQFPLLIKRHMSGRDKLQCANKKCHHFQSSE